MVMAIVKENQPDFHVKEESGRGWWDLGHASNYEVKDQKGCRNYLRMMLRWQVHLPDAAVRVARRTALMEAQQAVRLRRRGEGSGEGLGCSGLAEEVRAWTG
ncbi:hypothetical protein FCV25MIE_14763 [Fagus crenata]